MSIWISLQIAFNIIGVLAIWALWSKLSRPAKEDPRLSRGLQLLQSKISVLEDLSDKTDHQVNQLIRLLERKGKEVQSKIEMADKVLGKINTSINKSKDVAKIFEDKIPHTEIIERKKTRKYVKAAQMAHAGATIESIVEAVQLPISEVEMIVKVNRNELRFSSEELPSWLEENEMEEAHTPRPSENIESAFSSPLKKSESLEMIGEEFRKACQEVKDREVKEAVSENTMVETAVDKVVQQLGQSTVNRFKKISSGAQDVVDKVKFELEEKLGGTMELPLEESVVNPKNDAKKLEVVFESDDDVQSEQELVPIVSEPITVPVKEPQVKVLSPTKTREVSADTIKKFNFPRIDTI